ncbi:MAG: hypothetical protein KatS3mg103_0248 [Phycisphaerales bacterium]|nr:MAG: hypothetical protein KatS3mg103_0248 [Phycisphaerales bacterium]
MEDRLTTYFGQSLGVPIDQPLAFSDEGPLPAGVRVLDLESVLAQAQRTGREYLDAQEDYLLAAIALLRERHLWGPRLFNDTTLQVAGQGDEGAYDTAASLINELRLTQRLPSGGQLAARWIVNATEQLRSSATEDYVQSSQLVFEGDIPCCAGPGRWPARTLIQAERDLVYAARRFESFRRDYAVDIATQYFNLLQTAANIRNQQEQLRNLRQNLERQRARQEAGEIAPVRAGRSPRAAC